MARTDSFSPAWSGNRLTPGRHQAPHPGRYAHCDALDTPTIEFLLTRLGRMVFTAELDDAARLYGDILCTFYLFRDFGPVRDDQPPTFPDDVNLGAINYVAERLRRGDAVHPDFFKERLYDAWNVFNAKSLEEVMMKWVNYTFLYAMARKVKNRHSALVCYMLLPHYNEARSDAELGRLLAHDASEPMEPRPHPTQSIRLLFKRYYGHKPSGLHYLGYVDKIVPMHNDIAAVVVRGK